MAFSDAEYETKLREIEASLRLTEQVELPTLEEATQLFRDIPQLWKEATPEEQRKRVRHEQETNNYSPEVMNYLASCFQAQNDTKIENAEVDDKIREFRAEVVKIIEFTEDKKVEIEPTYDDTNDKEKEEKGRRAEELKSSGQA